MSEWVVRGSPTPAQLYLDGVLARARAQAPPGTHNHVSMAQLLFFCLKDAPDNVFMTNGATGEVFTNKDILLMCVPLARALEGRGWRGRAALAAVRDHQHAVALYFAMLFAGVVPMLTDPVSTQFELEHYMRLVEPTVVFCESAARAHTAAAAAAAAPHATLFTVDADDLTKLAEGHSADIHTFQVPDAEPDDITLMLPTSGSTGMPKAAQMTQRGALMQTPTSWMYHTQFPRPTERVMILTTPQWATFTMMITTCTVYQVSLLMSPKMPTVEHVLEMLEKYRPTWTFLGPAFAKALAKEATPDHFSSLETILTLGSHATSDIIDAIQEKMKPGRRLTDGYGTTETQGFICYTDPEGPPHTNGKVTNILHYKLVKENGGTAAIDEEGELLVKGDCFIKGYVKNSTELSESMTADGWLRTGDQFCLLPGERLAYRRRIKFSFKYNNQLVSPEELEGVVGSVEGVAQSVVVEHASGPAAAVVLAAGADRDKVLGQIHHTIESTLSDHKRLRGGVAFVEWQELPRTHTGKVNRARARDMYAQLASEGRCC